MKVLRCSRSKSFKSTSLAFGSLCSGAQSARNASWARAEISSGAGAVSPQGSSQLNDVRPSAGGSDLAVSRTSRGSASNHLAISAGLASRATMLRRSSAVLPSRASKGVASVGRSRSSFSDKYRRCSTGSTKSARGPMRLSATPKAETYHAGKTSTKAGRTIHRHAWPASPPLVASADVVAFHTAPAVSPGWPSRTSVYGGVCGLQPRTEGDPDDRDQH
jgi:hypothetical protein